MDKYTAVRPRTAPIVSMSALVRVYTDPDGRPLATIRETVERERPRVGPFALYHDLPLPIRPQVRSRRARK